MISSSFYLHSHTQTHPNTRLSHIHTLRYIPVTALTIQYVNNMNTITHTFTQITIPFPKHSYIYTYTSY